MVAIFVCVYWTEVLPATLHSMMFDDPSKTIFTVAILSSTTVLILDKLVAITCDNLRWSWCTGRDGIEALEFVALGNTSTLGLVQVVFSRGGTNAGPPFSRIRDAAFRFWACLR